MNAGGSSTKAKRGKGGGPDPGAAYPRGWRCRRCRTGRHPRRPHHLAAGRSSDYCTCALCNRLLLRRFPARPEVLMVKEA